MKGSLYKKKMWWVYNTEMKRANQGKEEKDLKNQSISQSVNQ